MYQKSRYIMYSSWDTEWDRQNFLSLWAIFCSFTTPTPTSLMIPKIKTLKKKKIKKCLKILSFYTYMKCKVQQTEIFFILSHFFPSSPLTTWKIKILTLKNLPGDIIILHNCTTNDNHMMYGSWDTECNRQNFLSF